VRFFVDWGDGSGFQDAGLTSFKAYDISEAPAGPQHPMSHMVYLELQELKHRKSCRTAVLPKVRAVLGWNEVPSLDPDDIPYYGNRRDAYIQLEPHNFTVKLLAEEGMIKPEALALLSTLDMDAVLPKAKATATPLGKLIAGYRDQAVPDHRMAYPVLAPMLSAGGSKLLAKESLQPDIMVLAELDLEAIVDTLASAEANTTFEEVVCLGLDSARDMVGAVIHIKRPSGYSGDLCDPTGSTEYVAFWADWNNDGKYDEYLGTATVEVHDIATVPASGLHYCVFLPVNVSKHLNKCSNPTVVRIRAVLSWATAPSTTDPDALQYWGNSIDHLVRLRYAEVTGTGLLDLLYYVGNVPVDNIDGATHLAVPSGGVLNPANCSQPAMDRPFGGAVSVKGRIYNTGAPGTVHYQVQYAPHGTANWLPVATSVTHHLAHPNPADPLYPEQAITVTSADGWFPYQEDPTAVPLILEKSALLATWSTHGVADGHYDLRLVYTTGYPITASSVIYHSDVVPIVVDNDDFDVSPDANVTVDPAYDLDIVIDGGDCHSYPQNAVIHGHLRARDKHFWKWELDLQPSSHTNGLQASPQCRSYASLVDQGPANGTWSLNVTQDGKKLDKCGYTLTLRAYDRAIIDSNGAVWHWKPKSVGFSIV
jgi:hypothetical protein